MHGLSVVFHCHQAKSRGNLSSSKIKVRLLFLVRSRWQGTLLAPALVGFQGKTWNFVCKFSFLLLPSQDTRGLSLDVRRSERPTRPSWVNFLLGEGAGEAGRDSSVLFLMVIWQVSELSGTADSLELRIGGKGTQAPCPLPQATPTD